MWEVEYTDEFEHWWRTLTEHEQIDLVASVELLEQMAPQLPGPMLIVSKAQNILT